MDNIQVDINALKDLPQMSIDEFMDTYKKTGFILTGPSKEKEDVFKHVRPSYNDAEHRYYMGSRIYRSATQIIEQFKNKFDTPVQAQAFADKHGMTAEYWIEKWKNINKDSLTRGNLLHKQKEDFLHNQGLAFVNKTVAKVYDPTKFSNVAYYDLADGTYPEMMFYDHNWGIAGRADKPTIETLIEESPFTRENVYLAPAHKNKYLHIGDYKSSKRIRRESFQKKDKSYVMMLGPLSHLMDCEFNHYALQFSLYQFMGEYFGFLPGERYIIHYPHEIEGLGTPDPYRIDTPYLRDEVLAMLHHLKETKWLN